MTPKQPTKDNTPASTPDFPESMTEMVESLGLSTVMQIVKEHGGTRLFIPKNMNAQHRLANLLGIEQARLLSSHFGGESLNIPRMAGAKRANRNQEIIRRYDAGDSVRVLAREFELTDRQIYNILGKPE